MKKIVVIGAGVSGLSIARLLVDGGNKVTVIEKENKPGGLIKCDNINGCLYHKVGDMYLIPSGKMYWNGLRVSLIKKRIFQKQIGILLFLCRIVD